MRITWIEAGKIAASGIPVGVKDLTDLRNQQIRAILTLTEHPLTIQSDIDESVFMALDIDSRHIPVIDQHPPDSEQVAPIVDYIDAMRVAGRPVLVHCHAGGGRTGTILHLYYLANGLSLEATKDKVKTTRPVSQFMMLTEAQQAFVVAYANGDN